MSSENHVLLLSWVKIIGSLPLHLVGINPIVDSVKSGFLNHSFERYKENPSIENLSKAVNITSNEEEAEENKFLEGIVQFGKT